MGFNSDPVMRPDLNIHTNHPPFFQDFAQACIKDEAPAVRHPGFDERAYGFRLFNDLLQEAQKRGLIQLTADEKSGGFTVRPGH